MAIHRQLASISLVLLAGCSAGPAPRTGFLQDYSGLRQVGQSDSLLEQRPPADFDPATYDAVLIEPTNVRVEHLSPADRTALAEAFRSALLERLNGTLRVVDRTGPGVLRVRTAIVAASRANVAANVATTFLIAPLSHGGVAAEAEVVDGASGRRIAALSWARRGAKLSQIGASYARLGEARAGLRAFADRLAGLLARDVDAMPHKR